MKLAYFISPHGFGHAARAAAVLYQINKISPDIQIEIYTTVPEWFFKNSFLKNYSYNHLRADIGLKQQTSLIADLEGTLTLLERYTESWEEKVNKLAKELIRDNIKGVVSDISPLGIAAAAKAGIQSILVENFTWDWIYQGYEKTHPAFIPYIKQFREIYQLADIRLQTQPFCEVQKNAIQIDPVSRSGLTTSDRFKITFGIDSATKLVTISMGGVKETIQNVEQLKVFSGLTFVLPGSSKRVVREDNLLFLPQNSDLYHPDLIQASDVVIGKVGYSTLAETFYSGAAFGFIARSGFRESAPLVRFIQNEMNGVQVEEADFYSGKWIQKLDALLEFKKQPPRIENGAVQAAKVICDALWRRN